MRLKPHPSLSSSSSLSPLVVAAIAVAVAVGVVQVVVDVDVDAVVVVVDVDVTCCSHDLLVRNPLNPCHGYGFFQGCDLPTCTCTCTYLHPQPVWVCKPVAFPMLHTVLEWVAHAWGVQVQKLNA